MSGKAGQMVKEYGAGASQLVWLAPRIFALAVAYFLAGKLSFSLAVSHGIVTHVVFFAEGFALSAAIVWGPRVWPGVFLGQLLLALSNDLSGGLALGVSAINSIEAALGAWLFRRWKLHLAVDRLLDVALLLVLTFLVLQPVSATFGTMALWWAGIISSDAFLGAWVSWWFGNALGQVLLTPFLLSLAQNGFGVQTSAERVRGLLLPLLLAILIGMAMSMDGQVSNGHLSFFLTAPLLALLAANYGMRAASMATLAIAGFSLYATKQGIGVFNDSERELIELDMFLLGIALTAQFVGALLAERKAAEGALENERTQLNQAQRIAALGSWRLDMVGKRLDWSEELYRILEFDPRSVRPGQAAFFERTHPDDRDSIKRAYADALASKMPYECRHRLIFPDGRIKHVRARGEIVWSRGGRPLAYYGTLLDITRIQETEERLNLYARLFLQSPEAIVVTDRQANIIEINPEFTRLTGYTLDEVRGRNPRVLASGKTPPETYRAMWQSLQECGTWAGELWDRTKKGEIYPKWISISALRDPYGEVTSYFATFVDISERKAAEERVNHLAHHDALTGLLNRFSLEHRLAQALAVARANEQKLAVMFLDMNRLKPINDTLGHKVGDQLLVEVSKRLVACARASDIVARLGGDEFVVVLTGIASRDAVVALAEKFSERLAEPYQLAEHSVDSSGSIGISLYPDHGATAGALMHFADVAMYHAKEAGRGQYRFYLRGMEETEAGA